MPFDTASYILGQRAAGGGGSSVTVEALDVTENGEYTAETGKAYSPVNVAVPQTTVEALSVTENGTVTAPSGKAYSPVTVAVPNSYSAGDEGKVVSNGALVAQTSDTVTQNGTVDTTLINSLLVAIPGLQTATFATVAQEMTLKDFLTANPIPLKYKSGIIFLFNNSDNAPTQGAGTTGWNAFAYYNGSQKFGMFAAYVTQLTAPNSIKWASVTGSNQTYFDISNGAITASGSTNATRYIPAGTVMVRADVPLSLDTRTFDYTEV